MYEIMIPLTGACDIILADDSLDPLPRTLSVVTMVTVVFTLTASPTNTLSTRR